MVSLLVPVASAAQPGWRAPNAAIREAVCPPRGRCRIESVLAAGRGRGGEPLALVRARWGRLCVDELSYHDWLVALRRGRVVRVRELAYGRTPCLEWEQSEWTFEDGELVFHFSGMGAPPATGTDMRRRHMHVRPWPILITSEIAGDERMLTPPTPARGPLIIMSME